MLCPRLLSRFTIASLLFLSPVLAVSQNAGEDKKTIAAATAATAVPALVPYSGVIPAAAGKPAPSEVGITFLVFRDEQGGDPVWAETQTVPVDGDGHYRVHLGATAATGIPDTLFASGEARWLEVQVAGEKPQARVPLASVPYAMKAADATTLGGLPVSAFQLAQPAGVGANAIKPDTTTSAVTTPGGVSGYLPVFSSAAAIDDSDLYQASGKVGIGTITPAATLDVNGSVAARGALTMESVGTATAGAGAKSQPLDFLVSTYSATSKAAVAPQFILQAEPSGNDTAAPSATLNLLYGAGAGSETGFSINSKGILTFASGQTFPGTGSSSSSITGITVTSPLTGGGSSGAIKLGLDTTKIPTLVSSPVFSSETGNGIVGVDAASVFNTAGVLGESGARSGATWVSAGVWGDSYQQVGVEGTSSQTVGVYGQSSASSGVEGVSASGTGTLGVAGSRTSFGGIAGVWGDAAAHVGVYGTSNLYSGVEGWSVSGTGMLGHSTAGNGVHGVSQNTSGIFGETSSTSYQDAAVYAYSHSNAMGVYGFSPTGTGVYGQAGDAAVGVKALGTTGEGLLAYATSGQGVLANATSGVGGEFVNASLTRGAVEAYNNANWPGGNSPNPVTILGSTSGYRTVGVKGVASNGVGVYGVGGGSSQINMQGVNGVGYAGVWGDTTGSGVLGTAIVGTASQSNAGIFANDSTEPTMIVLNYGSGQTVADVASRDSLPESAASPSPTKAVSDHFSVLEAITPQGTCGIGGRGDLTCEGQVKMLATTGGGARTVETYSMQSPENWMEDFGSGRLQNGVAKITIDPLFAGTVSATEQYHVFLTPKGDCRGLYVVAETASGFEVRESGGGTSSLAFDYRIVAKRRGYEAQRLVDVTEPLRAEKAAALKHVPAMARTAASEDR